LVQVASNDLLFIVIEHLCLLSGVILANNFSAKLKLLGIFFKVERYFHHQFASVLMFPT